LGLDPEGIKNTREIIPRFSGTRALPRMPQDR
jgi:hypothetical protein